MTTKDVETAETKRDWVEPEITILDVSETALVAGMGGDGGTLPDCTRS